jgi:hypothetical protein
MKKFIILLVVTFFLSLCGIAQAQETPKADAKKKVETTTTTKRVKTVKSTKKEASKCDKCKDKSTCTKKEKTN